MKLDKNIAILAGAAIAYIAQNTYDIAEAFDECTVKHLQSIAVEEYEALERED